MEVTDGSSSKRPDMASLAVVHRPGDQKRLDLSGSKPYKSKTSNLSQMPIKVSFDLTDLITESEAEEQAARINSSPIADERADLQQEADQSYDEEEEDYDEESIAQQQDETTEEEEEDPSFAEPQDESSDQETQPIS